MKTDLSEDESLLHYIKVASSLSDVKTLEESEEPPNKKLCPTENSSLHQVLQPVSGDDFADLMNSKRSRFNIKPDVELLESKIDTALKFEKQLVNAVCDPEILHLIAQKLTDLRACEQVE